MTSVCILFYSIDLSFFSSAEFLIAIRNKKCSGENSCSDTTHIHTTFLKRRDGATSCARKGETNVMYRCPFCTRERGEGRVLPPQLRSRTLTSVVYKNFPEIQLNWCYPSDDFLISIFEMQLKYILTFKRKIKNKENCD